MNLYRVTLQGMNSSIAGGGVAGHLYCFLGGDYENKECDKFISEKEFEEGVKYEV